MANNTAGPAGQGIDFNNRQLVDLIVPLVIEQLLAITVGLADSIMVASVGEAAVSAVSLVDSISSLMINVFAALATGGAVVAGQYLGQSRREEARRSGQQLLWLLLGVSLVITAAMYLFRGFWLHTIFGEIEPPVMAATQTYYGIVMASIPFIALQNGAAALFRTMGMSGITMKISLMMNLINVAGNALCIFGLNMQVEGVAIPTLISRMAAAGVILALLRRPGLPLCIQGVLRPRLEGRMVKNILSIGIPNGVESTMFHFGRLILTSMVAAMSTSAIVANAVGNVIGQFHIFAAQSIGLGMVTVVSRCVGAGDYAKARFYTRKLMKGMIWTQIAINALCLAVTPLVLWAYHLSPESGRLALILTALHAVMSMVLYPLAFGVCNTLRAAGDARYTMWVSSISMWVLRIFAGYVLGFPLRLGVVGLWSAQVILDWSARAICFGLRYRGRRWEEKALKG